MFGHCCQEWSTVWAADWLGRVRIDICADRRRGGLGHRSLAWAATWKLLKCLKSLLWASAGWGSKRLRNLWPCRSNRVRVNGQAKAIGTVGSTSQEASNSDSTSQETGNSAATTRCGSLGTVCNFHVQRCCSTQRCPPFGKLCCSNHISCSRTCKCQLVPPLPAAAPRTRSKPWSHWARSPVWNSSFSS